MDVFELIKKGDIPKLKECLSKNPSVLNIQRTDGQRPIHLAAAVSHPEILEFLLKQPNINIDSLDNEGNTALHHATKCSDMECVRLLLIANANPSVVNFQGKKAIDLVRDNDIKNMLAEKMGDPVTTKSIQMARIEFLRQIEAELPTTAAGLKSFILDILAANQLFQDRCKEKIRELIKAKHQTYYKYRLLENAAGLRDRRNKVNYLTQVQTQQHLNEEQAATISYLQIQNSMAEPAVSRLEELFRKGISELQDQYAQEIKVLNDRVSESESRLAEAYKLALNELSNIKKENADLKGGKFPFSGNESQILQKVQTENLSLQQKSKELLNDRQALFDKFKTSEQLKQVHEKEIIKIRNDTNLNRKILQELMTKVLNESSKTENDDLDESSGQIVFVRGENGSKQVKGATVEKLIERLTHQGAYVDNQFQAAFLLTFRSYTTATEVFDLLMKKYRTADTEKNLSLTGTTTQNAIHLRICKILKSWIENYFEDFKGNKEGILDKLNAFVIELESKSSKLAPIIKNAINKKLTEQPSEKKMNTQPKPKPVLPKPNSKKSVGAYEIERSGSITVSTQSLASVSRPNNSKSFNFGKTKLTEEEYKLTDLDPLEIARQLTLIEYELFTAIKPTEFLDQAWMKEDKEERAPNICQMTRWSNHVTHWIVSEIVSVKESIKARAGIYERVIILAQHLEKMNNFNGVKEVLAALQSSSVYRLKKTQENVSGKYMKIYENLMKLTSIEFNFKNLRSKVHASDPPLIPFPGIYQSDLVFMDTCNKSKLENGLINFMKHQKIASYILELQVYQQTPYNFEYVPEVADYIRNYPVLDENEAYNNSLICEPRGS